MHNSEFAKGHIHSLSILELLGLFYTESLFYRASTILFILWEFSELCYLFNFCRTKSVFIQQANVLSIYHIVCQLVIACEFYR